MIPAVLDKRSASEMIDKVNVKIGHKQIDHSWPHPMMSDACFARFSSIEMPLDDRSQDIAVAVVQILAWLASTFRMPLKGGPTCSELLVHGYGSVDVRLGQKYPVTSKKCWHDIVPNTIIALGFPTGMKEESGLDIAWEAMIELADMLFQTDLSMISVNQNNASLNDSAAQKESPLAQGIFYTGVGTLLYPVARNWGPMEDRDLIRWHFDAKAQSTMPPEDNFLPVDKGYDFAHSRHLLGFAPQNEVRLGTRDRMRDYARMRPVPGSIEQSVPELSVQTISAGLGKTPMVATIGAGIKYSQPLRGSRDPKERTYYSILKATEQQAVILCDCGSEKVAWLVSQISVILDLICYRIQKEGWTDLPKHAKPKANGGAAAANILSDANVYNKILAPGLGGEEDLTVLKLVKEIYCAMQQRRQVREMTVRGILRLRRKMLHSWDLLELADPPDEFSRRALVVHETSSRVVAQYPSWLPLADQIPVYSGQDLGRVVTIADRPIHMHGVAHGEKYLMANVHAMRSLLRPRPDCACYHFDCELVWERSMGEKWAYVNGIPQEVKNLADFLENVQTLRKASGHKCVARMNFAKVRSDGIIIFGPADNTLRGYLNDWADRNIPSN